MKNHSLIAASIAIVASAVGVWWFPWPDGNPFMGLAAAASPQLYMGMSFSYEVLWFTTPYLISYLVMEGIGGRRDHEPPEGKLPQYVDAANRGRLWITAGEIHHERTDGAAEVPYWLDIPESGLMTGVAVIGASGSGKTSAGLYPFSEQIFGTFASDPDRKIGGLVLDVKGDFSAHIRKVLKACGREDDYVEIGPESPWVYNPLNSELAPDAAAFAIGSLLENVFGKSKEPFWRMAYTNAINFVILAWKLSDGYVTLYDVYRSLVDTELLRQKIEQAVVRVFGERFFLFPEAVYQPRSKTLKGYGAVWHPDIDRWKAPWSEKLEAYVMKPGCISPSDYEPLHIGGVQDCAAANTLKEVEFWYWERWRKMEPKFRESITESVNVVLSLFATDLTIKNIFCPSQEVCREGQKVIRGFADLIESGKVCCLNFPASANESLSRIIGVLCKLDFERAVLNRIPKMDKDRERYWRHTAFICDEYQAFVTVGASDPIGDDKFFSQSRQPRCIPLIATQSLSSLRSAVPDETWRTVLQQFRTQIYLTAADVFTAQYAADACGRELTMRAGYSLSESGQDSSLTIDHRLRSKKSGTSTGKSYQPTMEHRFLAKDFAELPNFQSIILWYDGVNPKGPSRCYLKPYYLDRSKTYFEQRLIT